MKYLVILFILISSTANAKICTGRFLNPITDICWDCIFPISIGALSVPPPTSTRPDTANYPSPVCVCPGKALGAPLPGIAMGFWEPIRMADVTKSPLCMVSMGGVSLAPTGLSLIGSGTDNSDNNSAFWHIHWYMSPFVGLFNLLVDAHCIEASNFDLGYISEFDPLWNDDKLSAIINPEAILFGNLIAEAACAADCVAATAWTPLDALFWCNGCQGNIYPLTANSDSHVNPIQSASGTVQKFIYKLHRQLMLHITSGPEAICFPIPAPIVKKSQYRLQTTIPIPGQGPFGCNSFGKSTILHESFKEIPGTGEDFGFQIWRKKNCCFL